ncbi:hypothetical protein HWV03_21930 [Moritella sp. 36]|uniref:hypothetical protein n=1 Tax=Moritella sp. 36 TaxID=2746233 RepID=UPI001BAD3ADE|nr:hypothetical protein [Moritella sp. 36]QUM91232.1 hypothetical protein HWV03_21930 [Moritella sp. 36]
MTNGTNKKNMSAKEQETAQCFVIMPISSQSGYDDDHFKLVYEDIIKPSIIAAGLNPFRADETKNTNLIQLDILRNVIESEIAICDMSARNPNVFYELGMRQAFDLPTVLLRDEVTDAPFDVNGLRYVTYKKSMRHRDVVEAVKELTEAIKDTYAKRNDKSEINSLIRLMELASPATLNKVELSEEARYEKRNELHLKDIMSSIEHLSLNQNEIFIELRKSKREPGIFQNKENKENEQMRMQIEYMKEELMKAKDKERMMMSAKNITLPV